MCVGFNDKNARLEFFEREINYNIISGWADQKKLPKKQVWWPINGEKKPVPIKMTKARIKKYKAFHDYIKSYGWRK